MTLDKLEGLILQDEYGGNRILCDVDVWVIWSKNKIRLYKICLSDGQHDIVAERSKAQR